MERESSAHSGNDKFGSQRIIKRDAAVPQHGKGKAAPKGDPKGAAVPFINKSAKREVLTLILKNGKRQESSPTFQGLNALNYIVESRPGSVKEIHAFGEKITVSGGRPVW